MNDKCYSLAEICRLAGAKSYQIQYAISIGQLPEPKANVSGRRVFTDLELDLYRSHFDAKKQAAQSRRERNNTRKLNRTDSK